MDILTRVENQVGWLVLNRPATRNAISKAMWEAIPAALESLRADGARIVLLTGEGGAFASGADMTELQQISSEKQARDQWTAIRDALNAVARFELPTIAVIEGACMGGGCLLAAACDMRIADSGARFGVPVAQLGIVLDADNIKRLIDLCGKAMTAQLLFTAEVIDAERAATIGLVNKVVLGAELQSAALDTARRVLQNAHAAVVATKRTLVQLTGLSDEQDQSEMVASYISDEFRQRLSRALSKLE